MGIQRQTRGVEGTTIRQYTGIGWQIHIDNLMMHMPQGGIPRDLDAPEVLDRGTTSVPRFFLRHVRAQCVLGRSSMYIAQMLHV
jgi:hypothetical protein